MVVVTAIDGEEGSNRVLEEGEKLARQFDESLQIIFVYEPASHAYLTNQYMEITSDPSDEEAVTLAEKRIDDVVSDAIDEYEAIGKVGDPAEEILKHAGGVDARYIVIGGRSRSPVGKALFGSVTQSVLLDSDCPVLTILQ
ncbi:universal stress protein [Natronolimnobius baerhuensis]|uniref:Universal stress protein UspA n=1 Tax=Natronolimnobius baerhuensis TaxID=253108 RepID=A0A202E4M1_9EURY|nr:universal stress protein [Natronolimnobius baerhuensis]OVE83235.1 universal stress protein UspA [Natronolimnobius baerhuensis]